MFLIDPQLRCFLMLLAGSVWKIFQSTAANLQTFCLPKSHFTLYGKTFPQNIWFCGAAGPFLYKLTTFVKSCHLRRISIQHYLSSAHRHTDDICVSNRTEMAIKTSTYSPFFCLQENLALYKCTRIVNPCNARKLQNGDNCSQKTA